MFKTGSKFLLGLTVLGYLGAIVWAITTAPNAVGMDAVLGALTFGYKGEVGDHTGYAILMGLAATSGFLAIFLAALRDCDPDAEAQVAGLETVPEVVVPSTASYWPVVAAFSLAALALGLAFGPALFALGMVGLVICTVEWAARAWSDRATGDRTTSGLYSDGSMSDADDVTKKAAYEAWAQRMRRGDDLHIKGLFQLAFSGFKAMRVRPRAAPRERNGGDAVSGPSSVAEAIAAGERTAVAIDAKLTGAGHAFWRGYHDAGASFDPNADPVAYARERLQTISLEKRRQNFTEVKITGISA